MKERLNQYIETSPGFQYSVNVKYDYMSADKIAHYIPLSQSITVIRDVIVAARPDEKIRSRLLVGSYGTGKSHLCAVLVSILSKVLDFGEYSELLRKIENLDRDTAQLVRQELQDKKTLPVIITNGEKSFQQSLLIGLSKALENEGLSELMPRTAYKSAIAYIRQWQEEYPQAYKEFEEFVNGRNISVKTLEEQLLNFDENAMRLFSLAYQRVNHGSEFYPLLTGRAEEVYLEVARALPKKRYKGVMVLFDEFGKFLEGQWDGHIRIDLKPLQDFAEACNASGECPVQLMLVTHKPISQYMTQYGADFINEWKKVEGRFKTIEMANQPLQGYQLISQCICKEPDFWEAWINKYRILFDGLQHKLSRTRLFAELDATEFEQFILYGSYPLHPTSVFCLPRFSQKVAQNERTIFTFLSTNDFYTLNHFLNNTAVDSPDFLTLDVLFDYFELQMQATDPNDGIYQIWLQTSDALGRLDVCEITAAKILKALAVIKVIGLPGVLPPTQEILQLCYLGSALGETEVVHGVQLLLNKRILFEGSSTGGLEVIQPGEIDIENEARILMAKRNNQVDFFGILNRYFAPSPVLAKRYNDEYYMTRYFSCLFMSVGNAINSCSDIINKKIDKDGFIIYVIPASSEEINLAKDQFCHVDVDRTVFVTPTDFSMNKYEELFLLVRKLDSFKALLERVDSANHHREADRLELLLYIKHTEGEIKKSIDQLFCFIHTNVYYKGEIVRIGNKSEISRLVSEICLSNFALSPKFNNEMINKQVLTTPIVRARQKIVDGLLNPVLLPGLGITGLGPEQSIYRSVLLRKGLVIEADEDIRLGDLHSIDDKGVVASLSILRDRINDSVNGISFKEIMRILCRPPLGVRLGLSPILLAILVREHRNDILLLDNLGNEKPITSESLELAFQEPDDHFLVKQDWSEEKAKLSVELEKLFVYYIDRQAGLHSVTKRVADGIKRWFLSLARFTRDAKDLSRDAKELRRLIKRDNLSSAARLFIELPKALGYDSADDWKAVLRRVKGVKIEMENHLRVRLERLENELVGRLILPVGGSSSLLSSLRLWYDALPQRKKEHAFCDGTQRLMNLVSSYKGENSVDFAYKVFLCLTDLRPEDWAATVAQDVPEMFFNTLLEVEKLEDVYSGQNEVCATNEVVISFPLDGGDTIKRSFAKGSISPTGKLLQNVLESYIKQYGESITNNEKRQIVWTLLEKLIK